MDLRSERTPFVSALLCSLALLPMDDGTLRGGFPSCCGQRMKGKCPSPVRISCDLPLATLSGPAQKPLGQLSQDQLHLDASVGNIGKDAFPLSWRTS